MKKQIIVRRVITPLLILAVCMSFMVVPAKATSVQESVFFNVLDFASVQENSNYKWCEAGSTYVEFPLPMTMFVYYVDITIQAFYPFECWLEHPTFGSIPLTVHNISGRVYRIYGSLDAVSMSSIRLRFDNASVNWLNFERFDVSITPLDHMFTRASGLLEAFDVYEYIYRDPAVSDPAYVTGTIPADIDTSFILTIDVPEWNRFDFVDIQLYALCKDITSITCFYGDTTVPIEVSFIENGSDDSESSIYNISIRVDFTGVRRETIYDKYGEVIYPLIIVNGNLLTNHYFKFHLLQCSGYIVGNDISPLALHFKQLRQSLGAWFSQVTTAVSTGFQSVVNQFTSSPLVTKLSDIVSAIGIGVDRIVEAIWATSDQEQDDQMSEAASQATEIDDLIGDLDDVTKPSLEDLPADIEEIVDGNAVALATGGLAAIMVNPVLNPLFTLALIFSTAAYVLFGKR